MVRNQIKMKQHKCKYCEYEWEGRKRNPKACPACKRYFPLVELQEEIKHRKEDKKKEVNQKDGI